MLKRTRDIAVVASGWVACADVLTVTVGNHASTSDEDVFGILGQC
jgi:hypothetical protein